MGVDCGHLVVIFGLPPHCGALPPDCGAPPPPHRSAGGWGTLRNSSPCRGQLTRVSLMRARGRYGGVDYVVVVGVVAETNIIRNS